MLRAVPWNFAWTQTRFHLPVWPGVGTAFKHVMKEDIRNINMLREMYNGWLFSISIEQVGWSVLICWAA